jgi:hypothetical protein
MLATQEYGQSVWTLEERDGGSCTISFFEMEISIPASSSNDTQGQFYYSLRSILLFANIDVSRYILVENISVLVKSNMDRREY